MAGRILVIGGGPAGASAAIFLAGGDFEVVVVDRKKTFLHESVAPPKIGESLPPDARNLLQELGVWDSFEAGSHLRCYGNKSYWGGSHLRRQDFINHPVGHGWHIDRVEFEDMLVQKAIDLKVAFIEATTITESAFADNAWEVRLKQSGRSTIQKNFDFVIDATGRSSSFARRQGVDRLYEEQQLALISFLRTEQEIEDSTTLVESTDSGWWYSAPIPGNRLATACFCNPNRSEREGWSREAGWRELLSRAPHTNKRVLEVNGEFIASPRFASADSGILERLYGPRWLAVGDAAMSYDPIASHGLMMAMVSARDASAAIGQLLVEGDDKAPARYNAVMWAAFQQYARQRQQLYLQL